VEKNRSGNSPAVIVCTAQVRVAIRGVVIDLCSIRDVFKKSPLYFGNGMQSNTTVSLKVYL